MAKPLTFAAIPLPTTDPQALYQTCMALKEVVETMQSDNKGDGRPARMFVGKVTPTIERDGDFWLCNLSTSQTLNISVGKKWLQVGTLT